MQQRLWAAFEDWLSQPPPAELGQLPEQPLPAGDDVAASGTAGTATGTTRGTPSEPVTLGTAHGSTPATVPDEEAAAPESSGDGTTRGWDLCEVDG